MGLRCVVLVLGGLLCAVWASAAPVLNFATGPSGSSHHPHFSTDRAWYLTVGSGELLLWDARSERVVVRSPVDVGFLDGAVSPDLRWVMGSVDDDLVVYEAATGKLVRRFPKAGPAVAWVESTAAFRFADQSGLVQDYSPDRQQLTPLGRLSGPLRLISGDGSLGVTFDRRASLAKGKLGLRYWTLPTLKFTDTAETLSEAAMNRGDYWFTLSSSGRRLIAYENSGRGRLYTFDREKGTITSAELKGEVGFEASTFDASEQTIFHVGWYARSLLCSYDIGAQTDTPEKDLATNKQAESITISPDGSRFLISFFYGPIWVFEAGTRQAHRLWRDFSGFHLLGTTAGGGASFSLPGSLVVVPNAGVPRWFPLPAHQGGVTVGNDTYIADTSGNLLKVGTQDGAPGYRQPSSGDTVIASPNGKFVATFNAQSPRVRVYRASTGELLGRVNPTSASWPQNLALDPEGAFLLVGATADGAASYVGKYSVTTGKLVQKFLGTTSWGVSMVVSPDGKSLFGSDSDGNVIKWDFAKGTLLARQKVAGWPLHLLWTSDGRLVTVTTNGGVSTWDPATLRVLGKAAFAVGPALVETAYLSGRDQVVCEANDGVTRWFDRTTGELVASLAMTEDSQWITWTPDGYFDGSDFALQNFVYVVDGRTTYALDQFFERFHRPDVVGARLRKESTAVVPAGLTQGFAKPPAVTLLLLDQQGEKVKVRVVATDQGGGIDSLRLSVSGKAVGEEQRGIKVVDSGQTGLSRDFDVVVPAGDTVIRAVGFSRDRTESDPAQITVVYRPTQVRPPNLYVVAAAADHYRNSRYNLNFALADAQGFVQALRPGATKLFGDIRVTEVYDQDLTKDKLLAVLKAVQLQAQPNDVFIFFYAGHGIALPEGKQNKFHFVLPAVTVMNDDDNVRDNGLDGGQLRDAVAGIAANKQIVLVDACNSGALLEGFGYRGAAEENALAQLQRSAGVALFSASTDQQFANEVADLGHGLFTWAVMRGLGGEAATKDGRITVSSLKSYLDDAVPRLAKTYRGSEQFPLARISGQDFPLGVN